MPIKKSNPQKHSTRKGKPSAHARAASKVAGRRHGRAEASVPRSNKKTSQSRFPAERSLTGEDRPANRRDGKIRGKTAGRMARTGRVREV